MSAAFSLTKRNSSFCRLCKMRCKPMYKYGSSSKLSSSGQAWCTSHCQSKIVSEDIQIAPLFQKQQKLRTSRTYRRRENTHSRTSYRHLQHKIHSSLAGSTGAANAENFCVQR